MARNDTMTSGIYLLRSTRTKEWPYTTMLVVDGPFSDVAKAEKSFLDYSSIAGIGELKLRRWDGTHWKPAV
jgi:hypothetical protein